MDSKAYSLGFSWPYLVTGQPNRKSPNGDTGIWSHDAKKCPLLSIYSSREAQAEIKILNLLIHSSHVSGINKAEPTDAEIIFGSCDCEKLLCNRRSNKIGWDGSRLDWLWNLEQIDKLHRICRKHSMRNKFSKISSVAAQPKKGGCWRRWLCPSCCYGSDTESLDVCRSAMRL